MQQTKQGVRDLNGPRLTGAGYNGNKSASCSHHKAPDITPTHTIERHVKDDKALSGFRVASFTHCLQCGVELYEND